MATCLLNNPLDEDEIRYILGIARDWALTNGITYLKLISLLKWTLSVFTQPLSCTSVYNDMHEQLRTH